MHANPLNQSPFLTRSQLDRWADFYASETEQQTGILETWLVFRLAEERFAVPMERLSEITRVERGVGLCHSGPGILGLMNNRGEAVLLADMGQVLGIRGPCRPSPQHRALVFEDDQGIRTGFLVDRIEEVTCLTAERFQQQCPTGSDPRSRFIPAVADHDGHALAMVDVTSLLNAVR
jgi:purine-binding chemotaxis protein CheW